MPNYQRINNIIGWLVFFVAAFTYISTIEPTASYWDCGEFIATSFKLEVGHPPGAPLFAMVTRIFMLFAGNNLQMVPVMVNIFSALASAFTILFLFWTITAFARKIVLGDKGTELSNANVIAIMGAGAVGALAYTFSDSFWFSAVEGEVYATSSLFTALVFWCILKWENSAEEKHSARWIILIAYLMGLSIGVHLLNLLTIPAITFVYYFKKFKPTRKGIIYAGIISMVLLGLVQNIVIPKTIVLAAYFDLFFVNTLRLPFNSGVVFYALLLIGGIVWALNYTKKKQMVHWNTAILCFAFILIGYSSYASIVIRSVANPPMDENNPENVFNLVGYLNREQYGDWPLLYGQYYNAKVIDQKEGANIYTKGKDKYIVIGKKITPIYDPKFCGIFPRMWSSEPQRIRGYKDWAGIKSDAKPTFFQNLKFFFGYQIGWQYGRYFMWNFAGRQNDIEGDGNIKEGNWISGIKPIDALRLGNQSELPKTMTDNWGYNRFFFLPLILGLLGLFYHFKVRNRDAFVVFLLFLLTGVAIIVFLNPVPFQPRERDYAYVGSFYAFCIWIGIGVLWLVEQLQRKTNAKTAGVLATGLGLLAAPAIMLKDGLNDHNRSHRYTSHDIAADYLNSCAPNAILFTNGDNDTFPLWYAQEVEGIRTDVRVVNLSLLNTDWYIEQMKRKAYASDPIPHYISNDKLIGETRNYIPYYNESGVDEPMDITNLIKMVSSDDPSTKVGMRSGESINYYPTKIVSVPVDSAKVRNNGTVSKNYTGSIPNSIQWNLGKDYLMKADIAILDILAANHWERPVYFAVTVGDENYLGLESYFQLEGLAYRVVPVKTGESEGQPGTPETNIMYNNVMNKFVWGNMKDPRVYMDENNVRMGRSLRNVFTRLSEKLIDEGKSDSALKVLDKCLEEIPERAVPFDIYALALVQNYYRIALETKLKGSVNDLELNIANNAMQKANKLVERLSENYIDNFNYYLSLDRKYVNSLGNDFQQDMAVYRELLRMAESANQKSVAEKLRAKMSALEGKIQASGIFAQ